MEEIQEEVKPQSSPLLIQPAAGNQWRHTQRNAALKSFDGVCPVLIERAAWLSIAYEPALARTCVLVKSEAYLPVPHLADVSGVAG